MIYNFKEKAKLLRELLHPSHAKKDLELLKKIAPDCDLLKSPILSPERYGERILNALLDTTTVEEIRLNRRGNVKNSTPKRKKNGNSTKAKTAAGQKKKTVTGKSSKKGSTGQDVDAKSGNDNVKDKSGTVAGTDDKTKEQLDEVKEELKETKEELANTLEELEETQDLLEEEKKSE